ncbi:hypothetical protein [Methanimicrococcus hongohii]|uniref:hypothetical protein n=1 Tax=Methanimicrococcus hongohii TaxID=3028295 RepID=UPI00292D3CB2|nr:hypothetical protein [Methanimicrococcus sp. Hf6]
MSFVAAVAAAREPLHFSFCFPTLSLFFILFSKSKPKHPFRENVKPERPIKP